ncbi:MAG: S-methyl-5-thioribose-1-phosphate isomerase [Gemmatimonadota bacterium]
MSSDAEGIAGIPATIRWTEDGAGLLILDQTELPERRIEKELRTVEEVEEAIQSLRVRGAPLIGITAAMGVAALARRDLEEAEARGEQLAVEALRERTLERCDRLAEARPTAVNLAWALERMRRVAGEESREPTARKEAREPTAGPPVDPRETVALAGRLREEAELIHAEDREMCRRIGEHAVSLLRDGSTVITHCNAGALATGGIGTALAPIYVAHERGWGVKVFADETRPLLQGSRLTAWELTRAGVEVTVIADNTAGALLSRERPDAVLVGADRIAANGDVANKIGTYGLAVLARHHGVPFYVLAPTSTVDPGTPTGAEIPIEFRSADEVRRGFGAPTAPSEATVWSPAFDVTPAELVAGIVTEQGISTPPYEESLAAAVARAEAERAAGLEAVGAHLEPPRAGSR